MGKGKGGGKKKKGPKCLPDGTPMTNKSKKQANRAERAAAREKAAKKLMEDAARKAKEEKAAKALRANNGKKPKKKKPAAEEAPRLVGGPRKQGRGHRQRGAGSVAVAKGDVFVPSADATRREAERFPSELLQQYCQKNKLPRAHVFAREAPDKDSGKWKGVVKMPDPKGKKEKDRWFNTVELHSN